MENQNNDVKTSNQELENIKKEILGKAEPNKKRRSLRFGSIFVSGLLVVLTIFSVVQTVQSATILQKIKSGAIKPASAAGASLPGNVQDLPNMVGGC